MKESILLLLPFLVLILLMSFCLYNNLLTDIFFRDPSILQFNSLTETLESCSGFCPSSMSNCSVIGDAVLGGVDFVQYFTDFKLSEYSYDETKVGAVGSSEYQVTYKGYTFFFLSETNRNLFSQNPSRYIPQYGGFCAWAVSGAFTIHFFSSIFKWVDVLLAFFLFFLSPHSWIPSSFCSYYFQS
jgi:YHS domain-containing protein